MSINKRALFIFEFTTIPYKQCYKAAKKEHKDFIKYRRFFIDKK